MKGDVYLNRFTIRLLIEKKGNDFVLSLSVASFQCAPFAIQLFSNELILLVKEAKQVHAVAESCFRWFLQYNNLQRFVKTGCLSSNYLQESYKIL